MNWIISFRCGSSSDAKKASCGFQQLVGVAKLLILTAQLGYLCNEVYGQGLSNSAFAASGLCPLPGCVPRHVQLRCHSLARGIHRKVLCQNAVFYETDYAVLRILVKFLWHIPDFPIYSDGTKPGALHSQCDMGYVAVATQPGSRLI